MRKFILTVISIAAAFQFAFIAAPLTVHAQSAGNILGYTSSNLQGLGLGGDTQTESGRLLTIIGTIVRLLLGLMGVIFVLLIIYAGFLWMTAAGDDKKVTTSKAIIKNCIIGLVIMVLAYSITSYVFNLLQKATT